MFIKALASCFATVSVVLSLLFVEYVQAVLETQLNYSDSWHSLLDCTDVTFIMLLFVGLILLTTLSACLLFERAKPRVKQCTCSLRDRGFGLRKVNR